MELVSSEAYTYARVVNEQKSQASIAKYCRGFQRLFCDTSLVLLLNDHNCFMFIPH
jgi:hypothetical protein